MGILSASYPGALAIKSVRITVGHDGWAVALMRLVPQADLPAINGNLSITDGITSVTLYDCRVDRANVHFSGNGHVEVVQLLGRTWKWRFGVLDGVYNVRNPDGTVDTDTEKTPQELALLAFQECGESAPDVSALPNDDRPFVNWECESARQALHWLCDRAGCSFGLNVSQNRGQIWKLGQGLALPNNADVQSVGFGVDIAEPPDAVRICGGPILVQSMLKLENVMRDPSDLSFKKADDVSHKPAAGWEGVDPDHPVDEEQDVIAQQLAKEDYCRKWRPVSQSDDTLKVPGLDITVPSMEYCRPIFNTLASSYTNDDGKKVREPARLVGTFAVLGEPTPLGNTSAFTLCEVPFTVDSETGIVSTGRVPVVKFNDNNVLVAADLYLVCSYYVLDENKFNAIRHSKEQQIAANNTPTLGIDRPDIQLHYIAEYDEGSGTVKSVSDNQTDVDTAMQGQLTSVIEQFQPSASHAVRYRNLQPISPDGAIRQVTWLVQCGEPGRKGGAWTFAYRNTESEPGIPQYRERRRAFAAEHAHSRRQYEAWVRRREQRSGLL